MPVVLFWVLGGIATLFGGAWLASSTTKLLTTAAMIAAVYFVVKGGF